MPIVTITSDFGTTDYYLAIIKGTLLQLDATLNIIDISHNIKNYDIVQAAFVLKNAYHHFPKGSIHIISINNFYAAGRCFLAIRHDGHYFIGPDNGIFYLMFGDELKDIYELEQPPKSAFELNDYYKKAVGHLLQGLPFNEIGIPLDSIEQRISIQAVTTKSQIRGSVIHIDHYENVITNIDKTLFQQIGKSRSCQVSFRRHQPIQGISYNYSDVGVGETLCFFNSAGFLEIAINNGKASSMLGLMLEDSVQVDFDPS
ncbi:MAG: SAM-dependent chlorinase/fluorinase [Bacteroidota bacterium]